MRKLKILILGTALALSVMTAYAENYSIEVKGKSGEVLEFCNEDFEPFADETLKGVVIAKLPDEGILRVNGREIFEGEAVLSKALGGISYNCEKANVLKTDFSVIPIYEKNENFTPIPVNITLTPKENKPPVAEDIEIKTYKNIMVEGEFKASDSEGETLSYKITSKGKRGQVETLTGNGFSYTPFPNKTGNDKITYVAIDSEGNISEEAKIIVKIEKPKGNTTYADMDGNVAYYAAVRLAEEGIFEGEEICGVSYFHPERELSRAELISMVMNVTGKSEDLVETAITGFYDDGEIPAWFKPYAQAALKQGIIDGLDDENGRKILDASASATLGQATSIINNALGLTNAVSVKSEIDAPEEIVAAAVNLDAVGVINIEKPIDWNKTLTRADAAEMILKATEVPQNDRGGLLSWAFNIQ